MSTAFEALAEPTRRRILDEVRDRERSVGELVQRLELTQPGVSKHLRVLRDAGLVEVRQDAQRRLYRVRPEPLAEIDAWLAPYRRIWIDSFDRLDDYLRDLQKRERGGSVP
jgi:DNA-binding transcriptional ArsR family regulator